MSASFSMPVDLDPVVGEVLQRAQPRHRLGGGLGAALQQLDLLVHLGRQRAQAGEDHQVRGGLDEVHDVVQVAGQVVDVLAVERRHEAGVQLPEDRVRRLVAGVLEVAELVVQLRPPGVVVDELAQDVGGRHQVLRRGGEQRVEARVLGGQAEGHASAPYREWGTDGVRGDDARPSGSIGGRGRRRSRRPGSGREPRRRPRRSVTPARDATRSARARATRERMVPTGQPATSAASA